MSDEIKTIEDLEEKTETQPEETQVEPTAELEEIIQLKADKNKLEEDLSKLKDRYTKALQANNDLFNRLSTTNVVQETELDTLIKGWRK